MSRPGIDLERPTHMAAGFDYSTLPPELARQARDAAEAIHRNVLQTGQEIGRRLLGMKEMLPHGAFADWCKKALNVTPRSAQNYMNAAKWLDDKSETLSLLPATVIYELSAPSAPTEVVREVVAAAEAGALPEPAVILQNLEVARAETRAVKQALAKRPGLTAADARKHVAQKKKAHARKQESKQEKWRQEAAEHKARREHQREVAQRLVAKHREVVTEMVEAAEGDTYGLMAALVAALRAADAGS